MKKIYIISSGEKDKKYACTAEAVKILTECGIEVYTDARTASAKALNGKAAVCDEIGKCDAVVCIGGDGTIMRAASGASEEGIPLIGINLGHVGYLAELEPSELEMLKLLAKDEYVKEERMMLELQCSGTISGTALNDITVISSDRSQIAEFELLCDGDKVSTYRADGLILSTPTGSTAYNLAAGGPIIDPKLRCIVSAPVAPHSLKAKPLVFDSDSTLCIKSADKKKLLVCVDGRTVMQLGYGESINVTRSNKTASFLHVKLGENAFYNVLNNKMKD